MYDPCTCQGTLRNNLHHAHCPGSPQAQDDTKYAAMCIAKCMRHNAYHPFQCCVDAGRCAPYFFIIRSMVRRHKTNMMIQSMAHSVRHPQHTEIADTNYGACSVCQHTTLAKTNHNLYHLFLVCGPGWYAACSEPCVIICIIFFVCGFHGVIRLLLSMSSCCNTHKQKRCYKL